MEQICRQCQAAFEVTDEDLEFLRTVSPVFNGKIELIPPPTLCPLCRTQRRMAWRNHCRVYQTAATPERAAFSMWVPTSAFPYYENTRWFSDDWDPLATGQAFDPSSPFFEQFMTVHNRSPRYALDTIQMENSDYSNNADNSKNCYLCFNMSHSEDCIACDNTYGCRDCTDCTRIFHCERCTGCIDCDRCYGLQNGRGCDNCSESLFLHNCRSCRNCIGCVNLRRAEYCVFNEQKTPEEFAAIMQQLSLGSWSERKAFQEKFDAFVALQPQPHAVMRMTEECTGDYLLQCNDVKECMGIQEGEHLRHCQLLFNGSHHSHDVTLFGMNTEYCYESCIMGLNATRCCFCLSVWEGTSDMLYCTFCVSCKNCFGCTGLHRKQYCILNKQYTKEEYEALVPQIIARMREMGEWGEFFPIQHSPVPYNHSLAQFYFPFKQEEAQARGYFWYEEPQVERQAMSADELPDTVPEKDDAIIVKSMRSGRPFKLTPQEIKRYRQYNLPLPRTTYDERMEARTEKLGGIKLYDRTCAKTGKPIKTTYPPDSPFIIWDRDEYEKEFGS